MWTRCCVIHSFFEGFNRLKTGQIWKNGDWWEETKHNDKYGKEIITVKDEWTHIFNNWIKKAVESYPDKKLTCIRSGATPGNFIKGIVQDINSCELVIADLTGQKPNVYYELGIRHALRLGTITISQDLKAVPSDLQSYYCFEYTYETAGYKQDSAYKAFEAELHEKIKHILENPKAADNPVADFVKIEQYYREEEINKKQIRFVELWTTLIGIAIGYDDKIKKVLAKKDEWLKTNSFPPNEINSQIFSSIYSAFISEHFQEIMPKEKYEPLKYLITTYCDLYHKISQNWNHASITDSKAVIQNCITETEILLSMFERIHDAENVKQWEEKLKCGQMSFDEIIA